MIVTRLEPVPAAVYTAGLTYRIYKRAWHDNLKPEKPDAPNSAVNEERKKGETGGYAVPEGQLTKTTHGIIR